MHGSVRDFPGDSASLIEQLAQREAFKSFWTYRRYVNPRLILGWWPREVAVELQRFWDEYLAGKRPKLLIQSPPQHGKSTTAVDFLSWILGHRPGLKVIFASFSERLGIRANIRLQRVLVSPRWQGVFDWNILGDGLQRTSKFMEFIGDGYFRNTTLPDGTVTGEGLDIGIVDDPIKGRAEAGSQLIRDKTWDWMTDDFLPRFADRAGLLLIQTRWHLDDPAGRMVKLYPGVRVLRYPAICEKPERHWDLHDREFIREIGSPLFPELKSLEFLEAQRRVMTLSGWQSVYQQSPIPAGGGMFPIDKIVVVPERPARGDVVSSARYWDKAGTSDGGAYSAGVLMLRMKDGTYCVADVRRAQWAALDRERMIKQTAAIDNDIYPLTKIFLEQEPGSGGKESAEASVRMLAGFHAEADRVTGDKIARADPFAAQWQAGNIRIVGGAWNRDYLDEHEHFPVGRYKDQVDASSGAFNKIASKYRYPTDMRWVS
jgi:predicted phage terminase large subunit-like protein